MTTTDRATWLEDRRRGVGASDVAGIVGLSPWASPMSVWLDKTGRSIDHQTEAMEIGQFIENGILDLFEHREHTTVIDRQQMVWHDNGRHFATLDGRLDTYEGVEAKSTGENVWDEIPDQYAIQGQWQAHSAGLEVVHFAVLHTAFGRRTFRSYRLDRDQAIIDRLTAAVDRFWDTYVAPDVMPPADGTKATETALKDLYPLHSEWTEVDLDPELADEYHAAKAAHTRATADLDLAKQRIQQVMGDAETALVDGRPAFTWRTSSTTRLDAKALKATHPRAVTRFEKTTQSRRFLTK